MKRPSPAAMHPVNIVADQVADFVREQREHRRRDEAEITRPIGYLTAGGDLYCARCVTPTQSQLDEWTVIDATSPGKPEPCDLCRRYVRPMKRRHPSNKPIVWEARHDHGRHGDGSRVFHGAGLVIERKKLGQRWILRAGERVIASCRTLRQAKDEGRAFAARSPRTT